MSVWFYNLDGELINAAHVRKLSVLTRPATAPSSQTACIIAHMQSHGEEVLAKHDPTGELDTAGSEEWAHNLLCAVAFAIHGEKDGGFINVAQIADELAKQSSDEESPGEAADSGLTDDDIADLVHGESHQAAQGNGAHEGLEPQVAPTKPHKKSDK